MPLIKSRIALAFLAAAPHELKLHLQTKRFNFTAKGRETTAGGRAGLGVAMADFAV